MKTKLYYFSSLTVLFFLIGFSANAEDLRKIVSLSGYWKFSIGDDSKWASPAYDDSGWDQISVPGKWEEQGYNDYNGYAWYRRSFRMKETPDGATLILMMGRIDDADEVYLNGKQIGKSGKFPPNFLTAYDRTRKYIIPAEDLNKDGENLISVRVYDSYLDGGITDGPTGIYVDEDVELLNLNLSGNWKFQTGDNRNWKATDFNDEDWKSIFVPSVWENQGYEDYDGYAWYRMKFTLPQNLKAGDLYISLGKIDDVDDVYLNGEHIGNVYDLRKHSYWNNGWEYNARRIYKIPENSLKRTGINTLAVRVYDGQGLGGIYEGPIGIMSAENCRKYRNKHHNSENSSSFWEYIYNKFTNYDN
jgi:sialate O-acetylesterase